MEKRVVVNMGEMAVGKKDVRMVTGGVGSCLVVCIYDPETKIGGMAHSMFPERHDKTQVVDISEMDPKYVDEAIAKIAHDMELLGVERSNMVVKIVGGSTMFKMFVNDTKQSIGDLNIEIARSACLRQGLKINKEDVGGCGGKTVEFNLNSGILNVNVMI